MRFKIDWASLIVGSKFTVFALFYFVFEGNFPSTSPRGAYIWRGDLTEGFLRYRIGGLIHGGAYFRNFTVPFHVFSTFDMDKTSVNFRSFAELYLRSLMTHHSSSNSANLLISRRSFQWCQRIFPNLSMSKIEETEEGSP